MKSDKELHLYGQDLLELLCAVLSKGAGFRFQAKGFSMSPFIKDGDVITISPVKGTVSQIVPFIHPEGKNLRVHRIVWKTRGKFLIKGDHCNESDGLIPEENILGHVEKIERNGKNIRFGLGKERHLIAWLSRKRILNIMLFLGRLLIPSFIRRRIL
ncbi:MAG TPA: S26 family signal peptidase [Candidatus Eremiobacteraeota bacterium]|nr:MAG: hypothetical protein BWY64_02139 [bacterium ADurb.Bin363]HPZ09235.1 S26 family signal peptidase [Candidatus Eremiobacteraeota bacterium]